MTNHILVRLFCASLLFVTAGCYTLSTVNFGNGTKADIKVKSSQTGKEIEVAAGRFRKLPHAAGDLIVTTGANEQFKFSEVEPPVLDGNDPNYLVKEKSVFGPGYVTLSVLLETNMQLYVLVPGKKFVAGNVQQPKDYPKIGQKVN